MKRDEVVRILRVHLEGQFPKTCTMCGRVFDSLATYLEITTHLGAPHSYDAEDGDWQPVAPIGTMSLANCSCGTTLSLGTDGLGLITLWRLMSWARGETARRGVTFSALLEDLRQRVDSEVLAGTR